MISPVGCQRSVNLFKKTNTKENDIDEWDFNEQAFDFHNA